MKPTTEEHTDLCLEILKQRLQEKEKKITALENTLELLQQQLQHSQNETDTKVFFYNNCISIRNMISFIVISTSMISPLSITNDFEFDSAYLYLLPKKIFNFKCLYKLLIQGFFFL